MAVDLYCPNCGENLGKDKENPRVTGCGTCGETFFNDEGYYPFEEGDDYWTIENGSVVKSCWDDQSEEIYDEEENKHKRYFETKEEAIKAI